MSLLGPGIVFFSSPVALLVSLLVVRTPNIRLVPILALIISSLIFLFLLLQVLWAFWLRVLLRLGIINALNTRIKFKLYHYPAGVIRRSLINQLSGTS